MGISISVTEFKARCLEFFDRLSRHELDQIVVTKRGKAVAVVNPPLSSIEAVEAWQASMKGSVVVLDPDFDIVGPIAADQEFEPDAAILAR